MGSGIVGWWCLTFHSAGLFVVVLSISDKHKLSSSFFFRNDYGVDRASRIACAYPGSMYYFWTLGLVAHHKTNIKLTAFFICILTRFIVV